MWITTVNPLTYKIKPKAAAAPRPRGKPQGRLKAPPFPNDASPLPADGRGENNRTNGRVRFAYGLQPAFGSMATLKACRFATVWQKDKVKIKSNRPKSRFRAFLAGKRKRVTIFIYNGLKGFLEPLRNVQLAKSVERFEVAKILIL